MQKSTTARINSFLLENNLLIKTNPCISPDFCLDPSFVSKIGTDGRRHRLVVLKVTIDRIVAMRKK